jgi:hypothetical protein
LQAFGLDQNGGQIDPTTSACLQTEQTRFASIQNNLDKKKAEISQLEK